MERDSTRGLVIGCGSIGSRHARNLDEIGTDLLLFDDASERADALARELDAKSVESLAQAWSHEPDFAVVAVPTSLHVRMAKEAVEHGCHLFVEKPLSHTMAYVEDLCTRVADRELVSLVGCNLRFHPSICRIRSLLAEDAVGTVTAARFEFGSYLPEWHPDEDYRKMYSAKADLGGGVLLDNIHEIDYARWLLGDVTTVSCMAAGESHLEIETEDTAGLLLRFENGAIGQIHLDYVQREYSRGCQIIGDEGTIRWHWGDRCVRWYDAELDEIQTYSLADDWEFNSTYVDEMVHFLDCIDEGRTTRCDLREGKRSLKVALAAKASSARGSHVVLS